MPNWAATSSVFLTAAAAAGSGILVLVEIICLYKSCPSESSIFSIRYGGANLPFVAKDEYAEANSTGVTAPAPRVKEITGSNSDSIPILFAVPVSYTHLTLPTKRIV